MHIQAARPARGEGRNNNIVVTVVIPPSSKLRLCDTPSDSSDDCPIVNIFYEFVDTRQPQGLKTQSGSDTPGFLCLHIVTIVMSVGLETE